MLKALKIKSVPVLVKAKLVFNFFASLLFWKILFKFILASMKTLTNSGDYTGVASEFPHPPTRELWSWIHPLKKPTVNHPPVLLISNTITRFKSYPAYGTIFRITDGFLYAAISNLKRVTGRIFTINKCFHRSKPKLYLLCSS